MTTPAPQFTAAGLAKLLGKSPRIVRRWLARVRVSGHCVVRGNATAFWRFIDLPEFIRAKLESHAANRSCSVEELAARPDVWQPDIAWNEILAEQQNEAIALQKTMAPALEHYSAASNTAGYNWKQDANLQLLGLRAYESATGRSISAERWQYLFSRTLSRDRGAMQFHRPELFLSGNLKRNTPATAGAGDEDFKSIIEFINTKIRRDAPSIMDIASLWKEVSGFYLKQGPSKKFKKRLLNFLWRYAPFIAKSPNALRVNFDRRMKRGTDANAHADKRHDKLGTPTARPYDPEQLAMIKITASNLDGGRRAQAVTELSEAGLITDPRILRSLENRKSKSYLPESLHRELKDVAAWQAMHLGPRATQKLTPTGQLTYENIFAMTCTVGDDATPNNYTGISNVEGWFDPIRPQLLLFCDFRTNYILSRAIVPYPQYRAIDIVGALKKAWRKYGLPKFVLREGGIWRRSLLVNELSAIGSGKASNSSLAHSPAEIEFELECRGTAICDSMDALADKMSSVSVQFRESYKANTKPVEKVIDLFWNLTDKLPCFCGRNERIDCPESTRKAVELVKNRKAHPHDVGMMLWEEWVQAVDACIAKYNQTKQEGRKLTHPHTGEFLSPEEAFFKVFVNPNPPSGFDAGCEVLLASPPQEVEVKLPNIQRRDYPCGFVRIRKDFIYCDEQTGARMGQKLLAFWDFEMPETCTFTDLNMRNPFTVARLEPTNALYPDEQTSVTRAQAHRTIAPVKASYEAAKSKYEPIVRKNLVPSHLRHLSEHVRRETELISQRAQRKTDRVNTAAKSMKEAGIAESFARSGDEIAAKGAEMMLRAERGLDQGRDYVLNPDKKFTPKGDSQ